MFDQTPFEFEGKKYIRISTESDLCVGCCGESSALLCAFANRAGEQACGEYDSGWRIEEFIDPKSNDLSTLVDNLRQKIEAKKSNVAEDAKEFLKGVIECWNEEIDGGTMYIPHQYTVDVHPNEYSSDFINEFIKLTNELGFGVVHSKLTHSIILEVGEQK